MKLEKRGFFRKFPRVLGALTLTGAVGGLVGTTLGSAAAASTPPLIGAIDCSQTWGGNYLATIDGQVNGTGSQATVTLGSNCLGTPYYLAVYEASGNLVNGPYPDSQVSYPLGVDYPEYIYPQPTGNAVTFTTSASGALTATVNLPGTCWELDVFSFASVVGTIPTVFTAVDGLGYPPGVWGENGPFTLTNGVYTPSQCTPVQVSPPLTIGYWKNHPSVMSPLLPKDLGNYVVSTTDEGVAVLSNPAAQYAENQLAAQLLAAELNLAAGAASCPALTSTVLDANSLLATVGYNGPPSELIGPQSPYRTEAIDDASVLNDYNTGTLC